MKLRNALPSPALVIAILALFASLGGTAFAVSSSGEADRANPRGKLSLRFGKLVDRDTTAFDGVYNFATGHATCQKGERVISGGIRQKAGGAGVINSVRAVESSPVPAKRGWYVSMSSDLGGAARADFLVVANCEAK